MKEFISLIEAQGITHETVEAASRRGGDTPGNASKWKTYYRSATDPHYGVLLVYGDGDEDRESLNSQCAKLDEEANNYATLRSKGYDVPDVAERSIRVFDHIAGVPAIALIVEHISGKGPYKATTERQRISRLVAAAAPEIEERYQLAWEKLTRAAAEAAPMDLQLIVADDGRIVTIDPERVGPPVALRPL